MTIPKYDIPTLKSEYTIFNGTLDKKQYVYLFLKLFITLFIISFIIGIVARILGSGTIGMLLTLPFLVIGIIGAFSIAIRRLNDIGKPPIYSLALVVPVVNILFIIYLIITDTGGANSII